MPSGKFLNLSGVQSVRVDGGWLKNGSFLIGPLPGGIWKPYSTRHLLNLVIMAIIYRTDVCFSLLYCGGGIPHSTSKAPVTDMKFPPILCVYTTRDPHPHGDLTYKPVGRVERLGCQASSYLISPSIPDCSPERMHLFIHLPSMPADPFCHILLWNSVFSDHLILANLAAVKILLCVLM